MNDSEFMVAAIEQAALGSGQCSPNPCVGAVIAKDGKIIGKGYHRGTGLPHAEREALADANQVAAEEIAGSTIYVTLEPCSTQGRTPPCCDAIIEAGISRVVYASTDPNPAHQGAAKKRLENAGIEVVTGLMENEANHLIRGFRSVQERGRPWVISKLGMSLDGRLSRPPSESQWLTNPESRQQVQALRTQVDAILVGANTVRRDNPKLTLRGTWAEGKRQPRRVVLLGKSSSLPEDCEILNDEHHEKNILIERTSPETVLRRLSSEFGINTVLLEAGPTLQGAFRDAELIDEIRYFYAPLLCSGPDVAIGGEGSKSVGDATKLHKIEWHQHGNDLEMRALVDRS